MLCWCPVLLLLHLVSVRQEGVLIINFLGRGVVILVINFLGRRVVILKINLLGRRVVIGWLEWSRLRIAV